MQQSPAPWSGNANTLLPSTLSLRRQWHRRWRLHNRTGRRPRARRTKPRPFFSRASRSSCPVQHCGISNLTVPSSRYSRLIFMWRQAANLGGSFGVSAACQAYPTRLSIRHELRAVLRSRRFLARDYSANRTDVIIPPSVPSRRKHPPPPSGVQWIQGCPAHRAAPRRVQSARM